MVENTRTTRCTSGYSMHIGDSVSPRPTLKTNCTANANGIANSHHDGPTLDRQPPVVQLPTSLNTANNTITTTVMGSVKRNSMNRDETDLSTQISRGRLDAVTSFASFPRRRPESPSTCDVHWNGR